MALDLTDEEILRIAARHCEFSGEGNYHLRRYSGASAIVSVVRDCFELAELVRQALARVNGADGVIASDSASNKDVTGDPK